MIIFLDIELQIIQAWLVVTPYSRFYTVSNFLFRRYGGLNFSVKDCMSHFSMFAPTKSTVKLANGNQGHARVIGIILCRFPTCPIIYILWTVYYFLGHPSNTISLDSLEFYVGSQ